VPIGLLVAYSRHIVKGREMPRKVHSLRGLLHLFGHLLHDGVSHGGHGVLDCVHRDIGILFGWALSD